MAAAPRRVLLPAPGDGDDDDDSNDDNDDDPGWQAQLASGHQVSFR